jgi:hypothetical protein
MLQTPLDTNRSVHEPRVTGVCPHGPPTSDSTRKLRNTRARTPPRHLPRREAEAGSVAYVVLAALGLDISSSTVECVADWSHG